LSCKNRYLRIYFLPRSFFLRRGWCTELVEVSTNRTAIELISINKGFFKLLELANSPVAGEKHQQRRKPPGVLKAPGRVFKADIFFSTSKY